MRVCYTQAKDVGAPPFPHLLFPEKPPSSAAAAAPTMSQEELKKKAAHQAVELVESGMVLGLGTGSTAAHALDRIGELLRQGKLRDIVGIPTSKKTEAHAAAVDPELNLVKGRGGSLLREKMIEGASRRFVVIVDETKLVERIGGSGLAVPVEVVPFGWQLTMGRLKGLFEGYEACEARLRRAAAADDRPFVTDNGNYVVDLYFEDGIRRDLHLLSDQILRITGVAEHGVFIGMASSVIVAGRDGVTVMERRPK
ncbi:unnamed protein product [Spirodela intermedia]|uniref:ribose-5-phosphate isomerase n=1 Tax=Spirodela intermedia TaxID=51605 RepID=A0A7I8JMP2_SPIIN|nr:unnamed protein product [Spirodela intermedia]CAA6671399.1 unnamed protein product [Spirodela intermedia]